MSKETTLYKRKRRSGKKFARFTREEILRGIPEYKKPSPSKNKSK